MNPAMAMPMACVQECHGIYACTLYRAEESAALVAKARTIDAWDAAEVTIENDDGTSETLEDHSARSAFILDRSQGAVIHEEFEARVRRDVLPAIHEISGVTLEELVGTQLIRYQPGGHYDIHQDAGGVFANRYFTVVSYLNSDFEGGRTSFPTVPHVTRPETGKAIFFPSRYYHCAEPVTRGEKFVLITWVCGPVSVQWI
ncbi:MAG TPA: 2OG-Fe(II) oxygenase [Candidatus Bathyarchaeia archaeon]|nr:2OG-Fe(II) oxygenase [Candidatus Bathyarchaeia archaeon]